MSTLTGANDRSRRSAAANGVLVRRANWRLQSDGRRYDAWAGAGAVQASEVGAQSTSEATAATGRVMSRSAPSMRNLDETARCFGPTLRARSAYPAMRVKTAAF